MLKLSLASVPLGAHHPMLTGSDVAFGATPTLIDVPGCAPMLAAQNKNGHRHLHRRDSLNADAWQDLTIVTTSRSSIVGLPAFDAATGSIVIPTEPARPARIRHRQRRRVVAQRGGHRHR